MEYLLKYFLHKQHQHLMVYKNIPVYIQNEIIVRKRMNWHFPLSVLLGKDDEAEECADSGLVSASLSDTQNLNESEKSPSPTPDTCSPNDEELETEAPEEVFLLFGFSSLYAVIVIIAIKLPSYCSAF